MIIHVNESHPDLCETANPNAFIQVRQSVTHWVCSLACHKQQNNSKPQNRSLKGTKKKSICFILENSAYSPFCRNSPPSYFGT